MSLVIPLRDIRLEDRTLVGDKSFALARLMSQGIPVPDGLSLTTEAYQEYLQSTGLAERIQLELSRKPFEDMRWEELWDAALRIRSMFLQTMVPSSLLNRMRQPIEARFDRAPVAVRSSAPGEDEPGASFAGLHESFVNIAGIEEVLVSIKKVWASLWSDAALLYRKETGLDPSISSMAVLIQAVVVGERSGVAFSRSPASSGDEAVVESVHGLNQGLVDGSVEPDRWILDRNSRSILSHTAPQRDKVLRPGPAGLIMADLSDDEAEKPPLSPDEVRAVLDLALTAEADFGRAQDIEWTLAGSKLILLQSRPVTTLPESGDSRPWYLSLHRSLEQLLRLRQRIEEEHLPAMQAEAETLAARDPSSLEDDDLAAEIDHRLARFELWKGVYWKEFIPMAHGVRLFGQIYNDVLKPADPFEFLHLLEGGRLLGLERNRQLNVLAGLIRKDPVLRQDLRQGLDPGNAEFKTNLEAFWDRYGTLFCHEASCTRDRQDLVDLLLKLADEPQSGRPLTSGTDVPDRDRFLELFSGQSRTEAESLLDLARASYRLRDDDNIVLGRLEAQLIRALEAGRQRLAVRTGRSLVHLRPEAIVQVLKDPEAPLSEPESGPKPQAALELTPRQLRGQPAGPGLASGRARVIGSPADLRSFQAGEILVCDALDPTMTFVVPLAAGIVERRGGMLIHGAIIAREYGLPCVTGIPQATSILKTGDLLTVDGYLGILSVQRPES